jgi:hypothetical protein
LPINAVEKLIESQRNSPGTLFNSIFSEQKKKKGAAI